MDSKDLKIPIIFFLFLFSPVAAWAGGIRRADREREIQRTLDRVQADPFLNYLLRYNVQPLRQDISEKSNQRKKAIDETMHKIAVELTLEYFMAEGPQTFVVGDSGQSWRSKLTYPRKGGMPIYNIEIKYLPFSVSGSYGNSNFAKTTSTDTDWLLDITPDVWWESNSRCKPQTQIWNINLYYRLLDLNKSEDIQKKKEEESIYDVLKVDKLSLDIFTGYQEEKGRYRVNELVDTVEWWMPVNNPIDGLDTFFKIHYKGPRLGLRAQGSRGPFTTRVSLAYAWIEAKAHGWWNLRGRQFWLKGGDGNSINTDLDFIYNFTPSLSLGIGYKYLYTKTEKGSYRAEDYGVFQFDLDAWEESVSKLGGPTFFLKYLF